MAVAQALHNVERGSEGRDSKQYLERFSGEVERAMQGFADADGEVVIGMIVGLQRMFTDRKNTDIAT